MFDKSIPASFRQIFCPAASALTCIRPLCRARTSLQGKKFARKSTESDLSNTPNSLNYFSRQASNFQRRRAEVCDGEPGVFEPEGRVRPASQRILSLSPIPSLSPLPFLHRQQSLQHMNYRSIIKAIFEQCSLSLEKCNWIFASKKTLRDIF